MPEDEPIAQQQDLIKLDITGDQAIAILEAMMNQLDKAMRVVTDTDISKKDRLSVMDQYRVSAEAASFILGQLSDILLDIDEIPTDGPKA